jgi:MFS family permease
MVPSLNRHADFNWLWLGQSVSSFGTQVSMLAIPLTVVLYLHAGAAQLGVLSACERSAFLAPLLFIGVWVDRRARRPLLVGADLARATVLVAIPVFAWTHHLQVYVLYIAVLLVGSLSALFEVAYGAYLPSVVPAEQFAAGNRRMQGTESLSQILGPSIGGFLVTALGAPFAVLVDAGSFLFSAGSVARVRAVEPPPGGREPSEGRTTLREIGAGVKATVSEPVPRTLAGASSIFNFCIGILLTIFVLYAVRDRGMSAVQIGIVNAAFGAGGVLGAVLLGRALQRYGYGPFLMRAYLVAIAAVVSIPFVGGHGITATALFSAATFVSGVAVIGANIAETTLVQLIVPRHLQGRVRASFHFVIGALVPVAALVAGLLGTTIGLRATQAVSAALIPFSMLWFIRSPLPRLRTVEPAAAKD